MRHRLPQDRDRARPEQRVFRAQQLFPLSVGRRMRDTGGKGGPTPDPPSACGTQSSRPVFSAGASFGGHACLRKMGGSQRPQRDRAMWRILASTDPGVEPVAVERHGGMLYKVEILARPFVARESVLPMNLARPRPSRTRSIAATRDLSYEPLAPEDEDVAGAGRVAARGWRRGHAADTAGMASCPRKRRWLRPRRAQPPTNVPAPRAQCARGKPCRNPANP